ncbi:hypothetical protein F2Q70_00018801 [Brassica cretica]|uniref:Uncharacterized protein n=1 Tax=Brassica cretica TaxID=69181 RepID=A0A8S9HTQ0_BRACR|nr:hypothetical protein F2Q70_00018801 [Brassica cretica]
MTKGFQEYIENGNIRIPEEVNLTVTVLSTSYWPSYRISKRGELQNVSLKSQTLQLVSLVIDQLKKELPNEKTRPVVEKILESISAGFKNNTSCDQEVLFDLIYFFLHDEGIGNDSMAVGFALDLLLKRLKKSKLEELKQEEFFPLPSLTPEGDRLLTKALSIAKPGSNITLTVSLSFFQLLSWFIRSNKMKTDQLTEVMKLPEFEDIESDQHYRALLLFEAMVEGRSMDTEIHEIATINSYKTATIYLPQAAFLHKAPY